jgi:hypothetical protein
MNVGMGEVQDQPALPAFSTRLNRRPFAQQPLGNPEPEPLLAHPLRPRNQK